MEERQYEPRISPEAWAEVKDFVFDAVRDSRGLTAYSDRDLSLALGRLAHWATQRAGLEPEREQLLRRDVILRFIDRGCDGQSEASRGNIRSQLLRVSEVLGGTRAAPKKATPLGPADPSEPYSDAELTALGSWVETQSTAERIANARVLVALGLGAGLSASEIGNLRASSVWKDAAGVALDIDGARPRVVPVGQRWEHAVSARAEELGGDTFMFRPNHGAYYPNLITNFVGRGQKTGVLPQTQRLRATWIVAHLNAGTPVGPLLKAAGVESLEAFTRYARFLDPVDDLRFRALIRAVSGGGTGGDSPIGTAQRELNRKHL